MQAETVKEDDPVSSWRSSTRAALEAHLDRCRAETLDAYNEMLRSDCGVEDWQQLRGEIERMRYNRNDTVRMLGGLASIGALIVVLSRLDRSRCDTREAGDDLT